MPHFFSKFERIDNLAEIGNNADIHMAKHLATGALAMIKIAHRSSVPEAHMLHLCRGPHVVALIDSFSAGCISCIAMARHRTDVRAALSKVASVKDNKVSWKVEGWYWKVIRQMIAGSLVWPFIRAQLVFYELCALCASIAGFVSCVCDQVLHSEFTSSTSVCHVAALG
jgi:hypothetical protein